MFYGEKKPTNKTVKVLYAKKRMKGIMKCIKMV